MMQKTEYEIRVIEIDKEQLIKKLEKLGAKKEADYEQKRYTYNFKPVIKGKWIRLRTDGTKTTLTIKDIQNRNIDGTKELEIEVSDFETTNEILKELGYEVNNYQENRRTKYVLDGVELDIDSWPLIPTWLEIEGQSEEQILTMLERLELDKDKTTTLDPMGIYKQVYGIDIFNREVLKFEE